MACKGIGFHYMYPIDLVDERLFLRLGASTICLLKIEEYGA
jgi:hypothetical protein